MIVTYCNNSHVDKGPVLQSFPSFPLIILFVPLQFKGNKEPETKDDDGRDDVGRQGCPPDPECLNRQPSVYHLLLQNNLHFYKGSHNCLMFRCLDFRPSLKPREG